MLIEVLKTNTKLTKMMLFIKYLLNTGWSWGGNWSSSKDYQHFEKKV